MFYIPLSAFYSSDGNSGANSVRRDDIHRVMRWGVGLSALTLILSLMACDSGPSEPGDVIFPDTGVSYRRHVQPLFDVGCNFNGCHNSTDRAGNLSLESYFDVINKPGVVVPGDSAHSLLVQVVRERQQHTFSISSIITSDQARGIAVWVEEGASNN